MKEKFKENKTTLRYNISKKNIKRFYIKQYNIYKTQTSIGTWCINTFIRVYLVIYMVCNLMNIVLLETNANSLSGEQKYKIWNFHAFVAWKTIGK